MTFNQLENPSFRKKMSVPISDTYIYLTILGALAGTLAGLLGIGGGIVIVPALLWVYASVEAIPKDQTMHFALATSLATICFTAISSIYAHNRRGAVIWSSVFRLSPGIVVGTLVGTALAGLMSSEALVLFFGIFLLIVSIQMGLSSQPSSHRKIPGWFGTSLIGLFIGVISALVGVGGGTLTVPFLTWCNAPLRAAIASSSAVGFFIAVSGSIGYAWAGKNSIVPLSSGYIYWPAVMGIVPTSLIFAPLGARLTHTISIRLLKILFSIFLAIIGIKLIIKSFPSPDINSVMAAARRVVYFLGNKISELSSALKL